MLHHLVQEEPISSRRLEVKVLMDSRLLHCGTANTSDLPLGAKTWPTSSPKRGQGAALAALAKASLPVLFILDAACPEVVQTDWMRLSEKNGTNPMVWIGITFHNRQSP